MESIFTDIYKNLPKPVSFMPGPVAPWASTDPQSRVIALDLLKKNLTYKQNLQDSINEFNDSKTDPTSAVLSAFLLDDDSKNLDSLIFIKRPETMKTYSGQIAFPGGHREKEDQSLEETALRETFEEIGLNQNYINIIGYSEDVYTKTKDQLIAPYIGIIDKSSLESIIICEDEVADLHIVKIEQLLKPDKYFCEIWDTRDVSHQVHFFAVKDIEDKPVFIWGATANIVFNILKINF